MKEHQTTKSNRSGGLLSLACLALMLCVYAPQSQAKCTLGKGLDKNVINIALGTIFVPANAEGTLSRTIARKEFPVSHDDTSIVTCDSGGDSSLIGTVHKGVQHTSGNRIYSTNIYGIAIRIGFKPWPGQSPMHFPFSKANSEWSTNSKWMVTVELYKSHDKPGNGPLDEGIYASMYTSDDPQNALRVVVSGRATTISSPSCSVSDKDMKVQLGKVWKNMFSSVGSTAAEQRFSIKLSCWKVEPELNSVYLRMDATADASGAPGVIALTSNTNAATGVGIQILDKDRQPVAYRQSALVGVSKDGVYDVPFYARYYQTASQVTAGVANGTATFTLEYK
ncbi:fimbrial family protein 1 [Achromobacter xylosoxidans A8]|uniref:Fimbrial family protein 1 n=1 Tax=Achromobacter xylosoxidans (strain A8) TaxID=762376 RepID=E3HKN6_ACHXA|nr:fimbrial protein [Achromobacter xylosoxidans]ADP19324.1 fimbrial family protein 1 [Achromobacter xylosoxidans A8]